MEHYKLSDLDTLEAEAIHIMREVAAQFERPVLLFSGGKDSIVMLRLAEKAFRPAQFPFPVMHVDTGHNFPELIEFRDRLINDMGEELVVASVEDAIKRGVAHQPAGMISRNQAQAPTLVDAIERHKFDAAFGGGRRDEEKARAKERVFSFRDGFGGWDPINQRPELWNLYNGGIHSGENIRVFPISNWTELDVWQYVERENIPLPSVYFTHKRDVFLRDGQWLSVCEHLQPKPSEQVMKDAQVRCRTVGDMVCTGLIQSNATTVADIIAEVATTRVSERGGRADDRVHENAMELRKEKGYF